MHLPRKILGWFQVYVSVARLVPNAIARAGAENDVLVAFGLGGWLAAWLGEGSYYESAGL